MAVNEFHLVVKTFGDAVVAGEAPHGDDLAGPSRKSSVLGLTLLHAANIIGPRAKQNLHFANEGTKQYYAALVLVLKILAHIR